MWKDSLNAGNLEQYRKKLTKYIFTIIKDGDRYCVHSFIYTDPANIETIVTYFSDAVIAKNTVKAADSEDFDLRERKRIAEEEAIRRSQAETYVAITLIIGAIVGVIALWRYLLGSGALPLNPNGIERLRRW